MNDLKSFIACMHTWIGEFNLWYVELQKANPKAFPLKMNQSDWFEQFGVWLEHNIKETP